jgi:hypothetical protein
MLSRALPSAESIAVQLAGTAAIERVLSHVRERRRFAGGVPAVPVHNRLRSLATTALLWPTVTRR